MIKRILVVALFVLGTMGIKAQDAEKVEKAPEVKVIPGKGHQDDPASFERKELVDFVLKYCK